MRRLNESTTGRLKPASTGTSRLKPASTSFLLATAALLAMVTLGVYFAAKGRSSYVEPAAGVVRSGQPPAIPVATAGLRAAGEQHFERAKLVVLGLAAKEPATTHVEDWSYERELAASLLNDTRLYRMAAEQRDDASLAGVMRDLELVLLETSMSEHGDKDALAQIQRLIEKRALIEKMTSVAPAGM
jgi:hypothetical protein